jgi:hypothetical protein
MATMLTAYLHTGDSGFGFSASGPSSGRSLSATSATLLLPSRPEALLPSLPCQCVEGRFRIAEHKAVKGSRLGLQLGCIRGRLPGSHPLIEGCRMWESLLVLLGCTGISVTLLYLARERHCLYRGRRASAESKALTLLSVKPAQQMVCFLRTVLISDIPVKHGFGHETRCADGRSMFHRLAALRYGAYSSGHCTDLFIKSTAHSHAP